MFVADIDLDRVVAHLRTDPVVVERAVGSGEAAEYDDRIGALVRKVSFPVYVMLKNHITEGNYQALDAYALVLSRRLGPGLYVLGQNNSSISVTLQGYGTRPYVTSPVRFEAMDGIEQLTAPGAEGVVLPKVIQAETVVRAAAAAGAPTTWADLPEGAGASLIPAEEQQELAERSVTLEERARFRPTRLPYVSVEWTDPGKSTMVATWIGTAVAGVLLFLGFAPWRRRRRAGVPVRGVGKRRGIDPVPDPAVELRAARKEIERLARRIGSATEAGRLVPSSVLLGLDASRLVVESADVGDVIGARVLAGVALAELDGSEHGTCFFDPRHSAASGSVHWRLGQGQVEVPVCSDCAASMGPHRAPQTLRTPVKGQPRPYYERDDVWARTGYGALSGAVVGALASEVLTERGKRR